MFRTALIKQLKKYCAHDALEQEYKQQIIAFVEREVNCFNRELQIGHMTASCILLSPNLEQVLLMHHKKFDRWVHLGGHCDGNGDVLQVAMKECLEESGLEPTLISRGIFDLSVYDIPAFKQEPVHQHYDICFLFKASSALFTVNHESHGLKWVSFEEAGQLMGGDLGDRIVAKLSRLQADQFAFV